MELSVPLSDYVCDHCDDVTSVLSREDHRMIK